MPSEFKMSPGFKRIQTAIDPKLHNAKLKKHLQIANNKIGAHARLMIRNVIKSVNDMTENSPLTSAIKGSNKPLVDKGDLWGALTYQVVGDTAVFVGIMQNSNQYNIAVTLHNGVIIKVTPEMRGLFHSLWQASIGKMPVSKLSARAQELYERKPTGWLPLRETTTAIIIPPRPFMLKAFEDKGLEAYAQKTWNDALDSAFREASTGQGGTP
jgi:hypothetical protein